MSDVGIPIALAGTAGGVLLSAIAALWQQMRKAVANEREDCGRRVAAVEARMDRLEADSRAALALSARAVDEWRERWAREVQNGVRAYNLPAPPGPPIRPPLPSYADEEPTGVHAARTVLTNAARDDLLKEYVKSQHPPAFPRVPRPR